VVVLPPDGRRWHAAWRRRPPLPAPDWEYVAGRLMRRTEWGLVCGLRRGRGPAGRCALGAMPRPALACLQGAGRGRSGRPQAIAQQLAGRAGRVA